MLDAKKKEATNEVRICGKLNELDIREFTTHEGQPFISGTAEIICDQTINGKPAESRVVVKMTANRYKNDGNLNKVFDIIKGYENKFTSIAAADDPSDASEITINNARLSENLWVDNSGTERSSFQINGNFLNEKREGDEEGAFFSVTGYIFKIDDEMDKDGEPTGRIKLTVGVVGWGGRMNKIEMYAEGSAKAHIEQNWQIKDTLNIVGRINMVHKVETYTEEQGFGEPIKKTRTIFKKELIVTGGSQYGLEEEDSYDEDSIRQICGERLDRIEQMKVKVKEKNTKTSKSNINDLGF